MTIQWFGPIELDAAVRDRILPANVVLDVGAGIRPQTLVRSQVHICVEPHSTYVRALLDLAEGNPGLVVLAARWDEAMALLPDKSVDTVLALDFIEHLSKEDGARFLLEAERVAKGQVVVFTPLGFYPQGVPESGLDRWGLDGGEWQAHHSGWNQSDFDDQWQVLCCQSYHQLDEHDEPLEQPFGALWAIRNFDLPVARRRPRAAPGPPLASRRLRKWAGRLRKLLLGAP